MQIVRETTKNTLRGGGWGVHISIMVWNFGNSEIWFKRHLFLWKLSWNVLFYLENINFKIIYLLSKEQFQLCQIGGSNFWSQLVLCLSIAWTCNKWSEKVLASIKVRQQYKISQATFCLSWTVHFAIVLRTRERWNLLKRVYMQGHLKELLWTWSIQHDR